MIGLREKPYFLVMITDDQLNFPNLFRANLSPCRAHIINRGIVTHSPKFRVKGGKEAQHYVNSDSWL